MNLTDEIDDAGLLCRYAEARAEDAFAELVRRHIDGVYSSACRREEQNMDINAALESQALPQNDLAISQLRAQAHENYVTRERELLGKSGYALLREYDRSAQVRDMVSGYAGASVFTNDPISKAQADALVQAILDTSSIYQKGGSPYAATLDWTKIDDRAYNILAPEQFADFVSTDPSSPTGTSGRRQSQFWDLVRKAQEAEQISAGAK